MITAAHRAAVFRMTCSPTVLTVAIAVAVAVWQSAYAAAPPDTRDPSETKPVRDATPSGVYRDTDDDRPLAALQFQRTAGDNGPLEIEISASGADVAPIPGYRGIAGGNQYTAEELERILTGVYDVRIRTIAPSGAAVTGFMRPGRVGRLPERRFRPGAPLDFLARSAVPRPLSLIVDTAHSLSGPAATEVLVNGVPRLSVDYSLDRGRLVIHSIRSAGHDEQLLADPRWIRPGEHRRPAIGQWHVVSRRDDSPPAPPAHLLTDWDQRDDEGRWVVIRRDLDEHPERVEAWVEFLAEHQQLTLLEWLAIYVPDAFRSHHVGPRLASLEAPQWLRVAVWHQNAPVSFGHSRQIAIELLTSHRPGVAEHWLTEHKAEIDNWEPHVRAAFESLQSDDTPPQNSDHLLPPLEPQHVFRHLTPTEPVLRFGDRLTAEPDAVYVHQVLRAIDGVAVSGRSRPALLEQVRALTQHDQEQIRQAAFLAFTWLAPRYPATERFAEFLAVVNDTDAPAIVREAALMGYSYHNHPAVLLTLHDIAARPQHPAWSAAVSRLGDLGGGFSLDPLSRIPAAGLTDEQQQIRDDAVERIRARSESRISADDVARRLQTATFAERMDHPLADAITRWAVSGARQLNTEHRNQLRQRGPFAFGDYWIPGDRNAFESTWDALRDRATTDND